MSERDRTINGYNLPLLDGVENVGMYDIPALKPCDVVPDDLIGFNEAKTTVSFDAGVHFFLDDYQFERVWRRPDVYVRTLGRFQCVLTLISACTVTFLLLSSYITCTGRI